MKISTRSSTVLFATLSLFSAPLAHLSAADHEGAWLGHDRTRPAPRVVNAGTASTADRPGEAPSDATVLYNGGDLSKWVAMDGEPSKWITRDNAMECVPGSGYIRTLQSFG